MVATIARSRQIGICAFLACLSFLSLLFLPTAAAGLKPTPSEFLIAAFDYNSSAGISGDTVVYDAVRAGVFGIHGYDLASGTEFPISTGLSDRWMPAVDGDVVVWQGPPGDINIFGRELPYGEEFTVCSAAGQQLDPAVSGRVVVWEDRRDGESDIYGFDLITKTEFPVAISDSGFSVEPDISGHVVVWADNRAGDLDIYGYDLDTGTEFSICTAAGDQSEPAISGDVVVWDDDRGGDRDIFGFDLRRQTEFPVAVGLPDQSHPSVSGQTVVWQEYWPERGTDIAGSDLSDGSRFLICTAEGEQTYPAISGETVVWSDTRGGGHSVYGARLVPTPGLEVLSLASSAVPNENGWSNAASTTFRWDAADPAQATGYSYTLERFSPTIPDTVVDTTDTAVTLASLEGVSYFCVRACTDHGQWGPPMYLEVRIDSSAPWPWYIHVNEWDDYWGLEWFDVPITAISGWWRAEEDAALTWGASGMWYEEVSVDGGPFAGEVLIPAPADHSNDGVHHCVLRGVDLAGNAGDYPVDVGIDTARPSTTATAVRAVSGEAATFQFAVWDPLPSCGGAEVTIEIVRGRKVVATIPVGNVDLNAPSAYSRIVSLKRGAYRYRVLATDIAGNVATDTASAKLIVR